MTPSNETIHVRQPSASGEVCVAIVQSSYIPWKGYFDLIRSVDTFVLLDDAQFTKRDWRNRNRIKTAGGPRWLTIPVATKGRYFQAIDETQIAVPWAERHWAMLQQHYRKAACFNEMAPRIQPLYEAAGAEALLSRVNFIFLSGICEILGIATPIRWARDYAPSGKKTDRLLSICSALGATRYLSGPSAADYLDPVRFAAQGMTVTYADYSDYPEYPQLYPPFEHGVTILDLLFNVGRDAPTYMKPMTV